MTQFFMDLRHTLRAFRRTPWLIAAATLSIAVGVGANTAVYSWMDNLVWHPFPGIRDPGRIVGLETGFPDGDAGPVAFQTLADWRGARSFDGIAGWAMGRVSARREGDGSALSLVTTLVSGNYFEVLGGAVSLGRAILPEDEDTRTAVAVLSDAAWRSHFNSDRAIVGRVLSLNGSPFTIVGVAAPMFVGTYLGVVPDLFVPITLQPRLSGVDTLTDRRARAYQAVARLAPGVDVAAAQRELDALARRVSRDHGERPVLGAVVREARLRYLGGLVAPMLIATLVVTALLLLVACANVAGLLLVRTSARASELSLRLALGAGSGDLLRLIGIECLVLALAGSGLGLLLAHLMRDVLHYFIPVTTFPITLTVLLNARVLVFASVTATMVTVLCGVLPSLHLRRMAPGPELRGPRCSSGPASSRLRLAIVGAQIAFSLTCLVTAGLFLRGLMLAGAVDVGFAGPDRVLLINTDLSPARVSATQQAETLRAVLSEARRVPGADVVSLASFVPLGFGGRRVSTVRVDGYAPAPDEDMSVLRIAVASDYAATMGIGVLDGREFTSADRDDRNPVAMVNALLARRFWPDGSALGRRIDVGSGWATVVGVLRDGKYANLAELPQGVVYVNLEQAPVPAFTLQVRTRGAPLALVEPVRAALRRVHTDLPALQPRTLADHISASTFVPRVGATILSVFGAIGLLLAVVGLHAAISFIVASPGRELGIRSALGAGSGDLLRVALRPALLVIVAGLAGGSALGAIVAVALRSRLSHVSPVAPVDVTVLAACGLLLLAAGASAVLSPAARAMRADPVSVLRDG